MEKVILNVNGMSCMHCVNSIKTALGDIKGITDVNIDLEKQTVAVEYEENSVSKDKIKEMIEEQGYDVV